MLALTRQPKTTNPCCVSRPEWFGLAGALRYTAGIFYGEFICLVNCLARK